jgi:hypothetical protein
MTFLLECFCLPGDAQCGRIRAAMSPRAFGAARRKRCQEKARTIAWFPPRMPTVMQQGYHANKNMEIKNRAAKNSLQAGQARGI